jgi:hypothetical protein
MNREEETRKKKQGPKDSFGKQESFKNQYASFK